MVTALAAAISAIVAYIGKRHAKEGARLGRTIEDAVNHRHERTDTNGVAPPRLFDIALENRETLQDIQSWKNSYSDPEGGEGLLDTGEKVANFVHGNREEHQRLFDELGEIKNAIDEHVEWEMEEKYEH